MDPLEPAAHFSDLDDVEEPVDRLSELHRRNGRPRNDRRDRGGIVGTALVALGVAGLVSWGVLMIVEQARQTEQLRYQTCYARASASAQAESAVSAAGGKANTDGLGVVLFYCDKQSHFSK